MEKIKYKKKREYSHFCFCLGLRPGVIISSILWMIEGIVFSTIFITSATKIYKETENDEGEEITSIYYYFNDLSKILSLYFIILSLISTFGLASLIVYKSTLPLRMYSYISWFFAVFIYFVLAIVSDIAMMISKDRFIDYCRIVGNHQPDSYCVNKVNSQLFWLAVVLFFQGSIHIYFTIILRTYVKCCMQMETKQKQQKQQKKQKKHKQSPNNHNVFSIKVDKTFDSREQKA